MAKTVLKFLLLFPCLCFSFAKEGDEIEAIDRSITITEKNLASQKELKALMVKYREKQAIFAKNQTKENGAEMVILASKILAIIETNNYQALFPTIYLEELRVFAAIANKKAPARP